MRLFLFDDRVADAWHPFSLTRPCGELLYGAFLLRERLERYAGLKASATLTRPWLAAYSEAGAPAALPLDTPTGGEDRLFLSTRAVPAEAARFEGGADRPALLRMDGEVIGCFLPADQPDPGPDWLSEPGTLQGVALEWEAPGEVLPAAWSLIDGNRSRLAADLRADTDAVHADLPGTVHCIGEERVVLGPDVTLEPGVVLDTRQGAIRIEAGTQVRAGCRLQGPLYVGPHSRLLGGSLASVSAGPCSYLRGEVEESVVLGYANKAHDGFLGHSYLGRWVNLGALTTNSDLKNNYGRIRAGGPKGEVETGLQKLGCLLGDHVKTAIGALLDAGTIVGAGSNLFGGGRPPKWIEPFSWGHGPGAEVYDRERFLDTAAVVMSRRDVRCDEAARDWLGACWDAARGRPATP